MSILNKAIENGDLATVKNLIEEQGYSANYAGFFGLINIYPLPIKVAAQHNQPEILEYLIEKGANINGNTGTLYSPFMIAHEKGHIKIAVTLLLKQDLDLPEWMDKPSLIKRYMNYAIDADDASVVQKLLDYTKADISSTEFNSFSIIKMTLLDKACSAGATEVVSKLIALGANINLVDNMQTAALHRAVFKGNPEIVELLLDNGALVDLTGPENRTALMAASIAKGEEREKVLELLIKHGAEINKADDNGFTALKYAAISGNSHAIKTLLNVGADLNHKTNDGETAADLAFKYGHIEIATMLMPNSSEKLTEQTENIDAINIHDVLVTNNGSFISDVINNDNHQLSSTHHSQLVLEQAHSTTPQIYTAINQSFEEQQIVSFG